MNVSIKRRSLTESEITRLMQDIRLFPDLAYVSPARWRRLIDPYVLEVDRVFAGACGVYRFDHWIKLGPLVLLKKYHGKGLGKRLLKTIIDDYPAVSVFITSSHPAAQHTVESFGFQQVSSFFSLPKEVKRFLIRQLTEHMNISFLYEAIRKGFSLRKGKRKFYVKLADAGAASI
ncbi:GNAT family N-acetyltransferase [Candidatus Gottesmanbacteria bacterium]|nr:GNAT family N-acetyltransferase [Candidatus Gottesmanbacteria bacterium]